MFPFTANCVRATVVCVVSRTLPSSSISTLACSWTGCNQPPYELIVEGQSYRRRQKCRPGNQGNVLTESIRDAASSFRS
jgi:hypothetical protein